MKRHVAHEISYASAGRTKSARVLIRTVENATGRFRLIRRADGYVDEVAAGRDFWDVLLERYGLTLKVSAGSLSRIPADGPLILMANHPYGILDGMVLGHILSKTRDDFRILAHSVFRRAPELDKFILPVSFDDTKEAQRINIKTRKESLKFLAGGGAIGVFPGGTVSTSARLFSQPMDPGWRNFTARMVVKSGATVVPMFFEGHNSRLFQLASHIHNTLRLALLIKEFRARIDEPVRVVIGEPIAQSLLDAQGSDPKVLMDYLRNATYALSPKPLKSLGYGRESEKKYRN